VDVNDTQAFAEQVQRMLEDRHLKTQLTSRATRLSSRHSLDAMVRRYADLLEAARPQAPASAPHALAPHVN
jgi:glycosyltransferase involved in cell wall biosynthesis